MRKNDQAQLGELLSWELETPDGSRFLGAMQNQSLRQFWWKAAAHTVDLGKGCSNGIRPHRRIWFHWVSLR